MELHVWKYLLTHTFRELEEEHGINARPNATFDKFSLNYDQLTAKSGNPVSDQCRGLIVRPRERLAIRPGQSLSDTTWKDAVVGDVEVLAWPMNRFYNHGDFNAAPVDWSDPNLRVYEKVDGTCVILYWDPLHGKWHAGTRSVPEADLPINAGNLEIGDMTFSELFLKALIATREEVSGKPIDWPVDGPDKVIHLNKEVTYVFELVSPYNQIVVNYPHPRVYLLAARHTATGQEIHPEALRIEHVLRPRTWPINSLPALAAFVDTAPPSELEGAVVCDSAFRRLKVKSTAYVLAHRSKDSVTASPRNALEAIILEKADDIIPLIPEPVGRKILDMQVSYSRFCKQIDSNFARFREDAGSDRKRFAEQVLLSGDWTAPYFIMWEKRAASAHEWIKSNCEKGKLSSTSLDIILSRLTQ